MHDNEEEEPPLLPLEAVRLWCSAADGGGGGGTSLSVAAGGGGTFPAAAGGGGGGGGIFEAEGTRGIEGGPDEGAGGGGGGMSPLLLLLPPFIAFGPGDAGGGGGGGGMIPLFPVVAAFDGDGGANMFAWLPSGNDTLCCPAPRARKPKTDVARPSDAEEGVEEEEEGDGVESGGDEPAFTDSAEGATLWRGLLLLLLAKLPNPPAWFRKTLERRRSRSQKSFA